MLYVVTGNTKASNNLMVRRGSLEVSNFLRAKKALRALSVSVLTALENEPQEENTIPR